MAWNDSTVVDYYVVLCTATALRCLPLVAKLPLGIALFRVHSYLPASPPVPCGDPYKVTDGSLANTTKWFISPEPTPGMDHQVFFRLQDTVRTASPARGR